MMSRNRISELFVVAAILTLVAAATVTAHAQTYTDLYNLGTNAGDPLLPAWMGLFAQGRDGNLYATSQSGGDFIGGHQYGTIFRLTPSGTMTVLHSFDVAKDGALPNSGLTLGADGALYGTTPSGGPVGYGTVFKITTSGTFTVVHNFNGNTEGTTANAPPILGMDGNFYGTTGNGGTITGTVYKMTPKGNLTVLHSFDGVTRYPQAITLGLDGNFYGTFLGGTGANVNGGIFRMVKKKFVVLHAFNGTDGQNPMGAIIQGVDGNFYGTTRAGGTGGVGVVYKMTPSGNLTVLHNFANDGHGLAPFAGLVQATDGKLYGVTTTNPATSSGVLFQISTGGSYADVVFFSNTAGMFKGANPQVTPYQHTNGTLYGDTVGGGTGMNGCNFCGVLYSLNMGIGPFARLVFWTGKVGAAVQILGQGLNGTSSVSFNGTPASFNVVSDTYLTATVPPGATAGNVSVVTAAGTHASNHIFLVVPVITGFNPLSGPVGTSVTISGSGLAGVTLVKFGSKSAGFTVNNDGKITATVPAGAKTGKISVTSPGGLATSTTKFTVTP